MFAIKEEDVSIAAIDYFSFSHTLVGYLLFFIQNALFLIISGEHQFLACIIGEFVFALIWEIIENTIFYNRGIKFGFRRDSFLNSLFDIIFFVIGGYWALITFFLGFLFFLVNTTFILSVLPLIMKYYAEKVLKKKLDYLMIFKSREDK